MRIHMCTSIFDTSAVSAAAAENIYNRLLFNQRALSGAAASTPYWRTYSVRCGGRRAAGGRAPSLISAPGPPPATGPHRRSSASLTRSAIRIFSFLLFCRAYKSLWYGVTRTGGFLRRRRNRMPLLWVRNLAIGPCKHK
jgi:hypothetical protein